jgi:histidinol-phosphate aminotransferase
MCDFEPIPLDDELKIVPDDYIGLDGTIILANPNAPTGMTLDPGAIEDIVKTNADHLVVIDEAYADFGTQSSIPLTEKYDNVLVVQTLSKSRSLAGMRIGLAIGPEEVIEDINKMKFSFNPYDLSREAIAAAAAAMEDAAYFEETRGKIIATREWFVKEMQSLQFEVLPSSANFVFVKTGSPYFHAMREAGIILRHFDKDPIRNWVRITIGTDEQMQRLVEETKRWLMQQITGGNQ